MGNFLLNTDSYKLSHWKQYPPTTQQISSYVEARKGDEIVFFGLQYFLQKYMKNVYPEHIEEAKEIAEIHGEPFNKEGWQNLLKKYGCQTLPVYIEALPEGTVVKAGIPQVQIWNTDPEFYWLTSYIETAMLRSVWYPSSVATLSRKIKLLMKKYLDQTAETDDALPFMLHDFGARGATSYEAANLAGAAHLINFRGTDTVSSIPFIKRWYGYDEMPGFSVPAAEHSTITAWGDGNEEAAYRNMIETFGGPGKIYSVVSDSYDYYNAIENIWGESLRELVRNKGGKLVVRPDSGYTPQIVADTLQILGEKFGYTTNKKGYKVLSPEVGILQGDGVDYDMISKVLAFITIRGWSAENVVFGMGGALHQKVNRDTYSYAMKANAINHGDGWKDVYKKPKTDCGKASKAGRQAVVYDNAGLRSIPLEFLGNRSNLLKSVFNGKYNPTYSNKWDPIKIRASI